jgi:thioredoxin reductase
MTYDVVIVGGGPAGLAAATTLGRGRRKVLVLDAGEPRNARAHELHNFVTRDGIPPAEFRRIAHEQLAQYPNVERASARVTGISGGPDGFTVEGPDVQARRVILALGMVDMLPELPGYRELWGHAIFQCPYCHGWEVQDRPFGYLAPALAHAEFGIFLKGWSRDVVVFTDGKFEVGDELRAKLAAAGVGLEERALGGLVAEGDRLVAVELADGTRVAREVLFARPPQRQTALVEALGLELDENGFVKVDFRHQTSRPGIYAAGDMTTMMQAALAAAAAGSFAAGMVNHELAFAPEVAA